MKNANTEISFVLNENDIEVSLTLTHPERYVFEDTFDIDLLSANAFEQGILLGEFLAREIIAELHKLNVHVSYEAEAEIIDQAIDFTVFIDLE